MDAPPTPEQTGRPRPGRRRYVLDRRFQYKYTGMLAVLGGLIALGFGSLMFLAYRDAVRALAPAGGTQALERQDAMLVGLVLLGVVGLTLALALFGLLITHRIAGPVYVMSNYMGVLARGRYPIMRPLRKTDELRDFFERFEQAVEKIRGRELDELQVLEESLPVLQDLAATEEARRRVEALRAMLERKREAISRVPAGGHRRADAA